MLCLCAIAIYIALKLLSTWNPRGKTTCNNNFSLKWQTKSQLTSLIGITLTLIEKIIFRKFVYNTFDYKSKISGGNEQSFLCIR